MVNKAQACDCHKQIDQPKAKGFVVPEEEKWRCDGLSRVQTWALLMSLLTLPAEVSIEVATSKLTKIFGKPVEHLEEQKIWSSGLDGGGIGWKSKGQVKEEVDGKREKRKESSWWWGWKKTCLFLTACQLG